MVEKLWLLRTGDADQVPLGVGELPDDQVPLADIALRDFGLLLAALTLARLTGAYPARTPSGRRDSR